MGVIAYMPTDSNLDKWVWFTVILHVSQTQIICKARHTRVKCDLVDPDWL